MSPSVPRIILDINSEVALWSMTGAKGLMNLGLGWVTTGGGVISFSIYRSLSGL
jgi:hypothetical protein